VHETHCGELLDENTLMASIMHTTYAKIMRSGCQLNSCAVEFAPRVVSTGAMANPRRYPCMHGSVDTIFGHCTTKSSICVGTLEGANSNDNITIHLRVFTH
jgi:hypothetical protein